MANEFAIILRSGEQPKQASILADQLIAALQMPFELAGRIVRVGTSIGIAVTTDAAESAETLLHNADIALYRAKVRQRGTWELFSPEMDVERLSRLALERDLRAGLAEQQFEVFYQPLLEAGAGRTGGLRGAVALETSREGDGVTGRVHTHR